MKSYDSGARLSSNSWGARNGSYIVECAETDRFVYDNSDFLPVFSSGNYGEKGEQSVVAPGTAKNSLCVGAVRNVYIRDDAPETFYCMVNGPIVYQNENINVKRVLSQLSGRGPTYDLRFKPDVVGPG